MYLHLHLVHFIQTIKVKISATCSVESIENFYTFTCQGTNHLQAPFRSRRGNGCRRPKPPKQKKRGGQGPTPPDTCLVRAPQASAGQAPPNQTTKAHLSPFKGVVQYCTGGHQPTLWTHCPAARWRVHQLLAPPAAYWCAPAAGESPSAERLPCKGPPSRRRSSSPELLHCQQRPD